MYISVVCFLADMEECGFCRVNVCQVPISHSREKENRSEYVRNGVRQSAAASLGVRNEAVVVCLTKRPTWLKLHRRGHVAEI